MQFLNVLLVAAVVSAQSLPEIVAQIPSCALTCLATGAAAAGCAVTDYACQCGEKRSAITASATPCVLGSCTQEEALKVLGSVDKLCQAAGSAQGSTSAAAPAPATTTPQGNSPAASPTTTGPATTSTKAADTTTGSAIQTFSSRASPTASTTFAQVSANAGSNFKAGANVVGGALLIALVL